MLIDASSQVCDMMFSCGGDDEEWWVSPCVQTHAETHLRTCQQRMSIRARVVRTMTSRRMHALSGSRAKSGAYAFDSRDKPPSVHEHT